MMSRSARWRLMSLFLAVAVIHFVVSIGLTIYVFGAGMARFDKDGSPGLAERVADLVVTLLMFPALGLERWLPARFRGGGFPWEHSIFAANSLLWAAAIVALLRRRKSRHAGARAAPRAGS
jgi:hypothetical protein